MTLRQLRGSTRRQSELAEPERGEDRHQESGQSTGFSRRRDRLSRVRQGEEHSADDIVLLGGEKGWLRDVGTLAGPLWAVPRIARGLASGDIDNDGKIDRVIVSAGEFLAYFHNQGPTGHFLTLKLEGTRSSRDVIGANVTVTAGGRRQLAQRFGGGSFLSISDPRLHFGLGQANRAQSLEVRWPSGRADKFKDGAGDTAYHLRKGQGKLTPLYARP